MSERRRSITPSRKLSKEEQERKISQDIKEYTSLKKEEFRQEIRQQEIKRTLSQRRNSFPSMQNTNIFNNENNNSSDNLQKISQQSEQQQQSELDENSKQSQQQVQDINNNNISNQKDIIQFNKGSKTRYLEIQNFKFLELNCVDGKLIQINFQDKKTFPDTENTENNQNEQKQYQGKVITQIYDHLEKYFNRQLNENTFNSCEQYIHFDEKQYTQFQIKVWKELIRIPYGKTISYKQLAENIGQPTAVRAVSNACGQNPISIIVPCHRVIGSNKSLTGYAGGLWRKEYLLRLEGISI